MGFAISALLPSAAIVSAARQTVRAPSGNFSKSFRAALSLETGRVFRGSAIATGLHPCFMLSYLTTDCQETDGIDPGDP